MAKTLAFPEGGPETLENNSRQQSLFYFLYLHPPHFAVDLLRQADEVVMLQVEVPKGATLWL